MKKKKIVRFKFLARKFKNEIQAEVPHFSATQSPNISPLRASSYHHEKESFYDQINSCINYRAGKMEENNESLFFRLHIRLNIVKDEVRKDFKEEK